MIFSTMEGHFHWLKAKRIHTKNTHGTGCTLSSAIADKSWQKVRALLEAVTLAKQYITDCDYS